MAGNLVGNHNSRLYHAAGSRAIVRMSARNRVAFGTAAATEAAGYQSARDCTPQP